jgi:hypothetical protein
VEQNKDQMAADSAASLTSGSDASDVSPYKCFANIQWWKNALLLSVVFARHCILPSLLWLSALATLLIPSIFLVVTFKKSVVEISQLVQALAVYVGTAIVAVPLIFFCFGTWLARLTAYSAAFQSFSREELLSDNLQKARIVTLQSEALERTKRQKIFLAKFWTTLTIILIVPCFVFFVSMLVLCCTSATVLGSSALQLPAAFVVVVKVLCAVSGLITTVVSFVGITVSAVTDTEPVKQAKKAVSDSVKGLFPLTIITALSVLATVLITSPQEIFQSGPVALGAINVSWISVAQEIWRAISSTIVWTISLAPVCEYMRGKQA